MRFLAVIPMLVLVASGGQPTPTSAPPPPGSMEAAAVAKWESRLRLLDPGRPMEYFLLGEEVADEAEDIGARSLARHLFVLSYELGAREAGAPPALGRSVCLALASLATREDERRWLRALADTLAERPLAVGAPAADTSASWPLDTAFDLATAMGQARSGEARRSEQLLERPGVGELLGLIDSTPMPDGSLGSLQSFIRRAIRDWPACPQCRNRRVVPAGVARSGEMVLCDTCRGNPGPRLSEEDLANQLRIEAMLLQGTQRSWAAQVLADAGAPLRDLDASELAGTYEVDPEKPVWRNGAWSAADAAPGEEPAP